MNWIAQAATTLQPTIQRIKTLLLSGSFLHADETGIRLKGLLHWVHVASTRFLTLYSWHRKRGQEAMAQIGVWPHFARRAMQALLAGREELYEYGFTTRHIAAQVDVTPPFVEFAGVNPELV